MKSRARSRRTVATAAVLLGMLGAGQHGVALAGAGGRATGQQAVTSGSFAVVPSKLTTPVAGPLLLSYAAILSPPAQYFDAVNTGSVSLSSAGYSVRVVGGGLGTPSITLTACSGGSWNTGSGACSGTTVAIGTWSGTSAPVVRSTAVPSAPGARLGIKATVSVLGTLTLLTEATVSITVASGPVRDVRAASTTG